MKSYFKLVWAALCNREIANKLEITGTIRMRGPGAIARNCTLNP